MTSIVTLITDWGSDGAYSGALKGLVLQATPSINFIDISHSIRPFDKLQAAFVLKNTYKFYPKGTVHIVGVGGKERVGQNTRIAFEKEGYYFLGANNGFWGLIFETPPVSFYELRLDSLLVFPELSCYANAISTIIKNGSVETVGKKLSSITINYAPLPTVSSNVITGQVSFIDTFGNAITNISRLDFNRIHNNRKFKIYITSQRHFVDKINDTYDQTDNLELLAIFSYTGYLEIAMANANVREMLNLQIGSVIRVVFEEQLDSLDVEETPLLGKL